MILEILEAFFKLGLPILLAAWLMFSYMYRVGTVDAEATKKETEQRLKTLRKERKNSPDNHQENFFFNRWMKFGGGFYGLAALWTLIIVEIIDVTTFLFELPSFFNQFEGGVIDLLVLFFINQINNLVTAVTWFIYWPNGVNMWWALVAYVSYLAGIECAKRYDLASMLNANLRRSN